MYISKEVPTGDIDGVNKVFTLLNDVDYILDIYVDGAVYVSFSRDSKIITLTDAPVGTIWVDYESGSADVSVDTSCTFGNIKSEVWELLGQTSNSTNFSDTRIGKAINVLAEQVWKGRVINILNGKLYRAGDMYFKNGELSIRIKSGGALTESLEVGDTEALTDTTFLLSAGYVEIGGDIINYTAKSDDQLEGVTGQTIEHLETEKIIQLYELPTTTDKVSKVEVVSTGQYAKKREIPLDNTDSFGCYYQIIRSGTQQLIKIVGLSNDDIIKVTYVSKYVYMTSDSEDCPLPDSYGISVLANIVAGSAGYKKGMINAEQQLNIGYSSLQVMYGDFNDETYIVKQSIRPQSNMRNRISGGRRF